MKTLIAVLTLAVVLVAPAQAEMKPAMAALTDDLARNCARLALVAKDVGSTLYVGAEARFLMEVSEHLDPSEAQIQHPRFEWSMGELEAKRFVVSEEDAGIARPNVEKALADCLAIPGKNP